MGDGIRRINIGDAIRAVQGYLLRSDIDEVAKVYTQLAANDEVIVVGSNKESARFKDGYHTQKVRVRISSDSDCDDPSAAGDMDGCWRIWSFSDRHINYKSPIELGFFNTGELLSEEDLSDNTITAEERTELIRKLEVGLAFKLGYYEHGRCSWFLQGRGGPGTDCRWDGTAFAGLLVWEEDEENIGAKTYEDRAKDATGFIEQYTAWCNGECYGYSVDNLAGDCLDSCWDFYGSDVEYMFAQIQEATEGLEVVGIDGDAAWLAEHRDVQKKPEEVKS